jgi:hypothetical protein
MSLVGEQNAKYVYQAPSEFFGRHAISGDNVPLTLTIAAPGGILRNSFNYIHWSYDGSPTNGAITITSGDITETMYVTSGGVGFLPFEGVAFPVATAVTVTLSAGGTNVNGSLALIGVRAI